MEHHVEVGGRLVARLYDLAGDKVTIDLSPARQAHRNSHCGYAMPAGLDALDQKYGRGSFKVRVSVDVARETVLRYARMPDAKAAKVLA